MLSKYTRKVGYNVNLMTYSTIRFLVYSKRSTSKPQSVPIQTFQTAEEAAAYTVYVGGEDDIIETKI